MCVRVTGRQCRALGILYQEGRVLPPKSNDSGAKFPRALGPPCIPVQGAAGLFSLRRDRTGPGRGDAVLLRFAAETATGNWTCNLPPEHE
jgi:hypothetical protein